MSGHIDIVCDGPPAHESGRFVEVEDDQGKSINAGEWILRNDGYWALRIQMPDLDGLHALLAKRDKETMSHVKTLSTAEVRLALKSEKTETKVSPAREGSGDLGQCGGSIHSLSPPLERCSLVEGHEGDCE